MSRSVNPQCRSITGTDALPWLSHFHASVHTKRPAASVALSRTSSYWCTLLSCLSSRWRTCHMSSQGHAVISVVTMTCCHVCRHTDALLCLSLCWRTVTSVITVTCRHTRCHTAITLKHCHICRHWYTVASVVSDTDPPRNVVSQCINTATAALLVNLETVNR